jgi:hypothetical protein
MWWVVATFGLIALLSGLAGVWRLQHDLEHVRRERDVLEVQNANLRSLLERRDATIRVSVRELNWYESQRCELLSRLEANLGPEPDDDVARGRGANGGV